MADIAAGNVTYAEQFNKARRVEGPRATGTQHIVNVTFGDTALTVGATGIPLVKASLGCPTYVKRLRVLAVISPAGTSVDDYIWNGSETSPALFQVTGGDNTPAATVLELEVEGY